VNPRPNIPAASPVRVAADTALDPLVESYRKLADVFHELLSEQSLDDLLQRIAATVGELIPFDDITFYEANEAKRELRAVFASGHDAEKVLADEPFSYGVGITGWAVSTASRCWRTAPSSTRASGSSPTPRPTPSR